MESWNELVEQAKIDGFTTSIPSGAVPTDGYMVALSGHEVTFPVDEFTASDLIRYVADKFDVLSGPGEVYLGAWMADGLVYLDVSECIADRGLALDVAKLRSQLAIWDVVKRAEVAARASA